MIIYKCILLIVSPVIDSIPVLVQYSEDQNPLLGRKFCSERDYPQRIVGIAEQNYAFEEMKQVMNV